MSRVERSGRAKKRQNGAIGRRSTVAAAALEKKRLCLTGFSLYPASSVPGLWRGPVGGKPKLLLWISWSLELAIWILCPPQEQHGHGCGDEDAAAPGRNRFEFTPFMYAIFLGLYQVWSKIPWFTWSKLCKLMVYIGLHQVYIGLHWDYTWFTLGLQRPGLFPGEKSLVWFFQNQCKH